MSVCHQGQAWKSRDGVVLLNALDFIGRRDDCVRVAGLPAPIRNCFAPSQFCLAEHWRTAAMIRKLRSGQYRLYSRKINPRTGKRRNLGTFKSRAAAEKHERDVQYFKRH